MKQNHKSLFILLFVFVAVFVVSGIRPAFAEPPGRPLCDGGKVPKADGTGCECPSGLKEVGGKCQLKNPAEGILVSIEDFGDLLQKIIQILLYVAGAIAVIFLMMGGFRYVTASGNDEAVEKAKKTVTNSLLGIVIIVLSYTIVLIVNTLLTSPAPQ